MADPVSNPNDLIERAQQMQDALEALNQKELSLTQSYYRDPRIQFPEFKGAAAAQYHAAKAGLDAQRSAIQNQQRLLQQNSARLVSDQRHAAQAQAAAQKAQDAQVKQQTDATKSQLAGILGVDDPKKLGSTLNKAFYDPVTHRVIVPDKDSKAAKDEIQDAKHAYSQLKTELKGYAPTDSATGKTTPLDPGSLFGPRPLPYTEDEDGNRVYKDRTGNVVATVPSDEVERLQGLYNDSVVRPSENVRTVNPDEFSAVRQRLDLLQGSNTPDIVAAAQQRASNARLAAPAVAAAVTPQSPVSLIPGQQTPGLNIPSEVVPSIVPTVSGRALPSDNFSASVAPQDLRLAPFLQGYKTEDQKAYDTYRQFAPGATDAQIDQSLNKAKAALGDNATPERLRNFVIQDRQADIDRNAPGPVDRLSSLSQFHPLVTGGLGMVAIPGNNVVSDAARNLYQSYGAPVAAMFAPPNNLSLLDQDRIRAIQNNVVPPNTTLDQYSDYVNKVKQEGEDNLPNFSNF